MNHFTVLLLSVLLSACSGVGGVEGVQFAPSSVTALSETSVSVQWRLPSDLATTDVSSISIYGSTGSEAEPDFTQAALASGISPSATGTTISGLDAGSSGRMMIVAQTNTGKTAIYGNSARYWTPYGAVLQTSVNAMHANLPTLNDYPISTGYNYGESPFVSDNFSFFKRGFYAPESTYVFNGNPTNLSTQFEYNWGALIYNQNGFDDSSFLNDKGQVWSDGLAKVAIAESYGGNRVLLFNHLPLSPDTARPDVVLGQPDLVSRAANNLSSGGNQYGLNIPFGVCFNGTTLYVSDVNNNRILGWNTWPTVNGQVPDFVLGQPNFATLSANSGGSPSKSTISSASANASIDCTANRLVVSDPGNNRVLIWNTAPTANVAATYVIGQTSGTLNAADGGGIGVSGVSNPSGVALVPNGGAMAVVVNDTGNNRLLQWNSVPTSDGAAFDFVYGQPNSTANAVNNGGSATASLGGNGALNTEFDGAGNRKSFFWLGDTTNGRWTRYALGTAAAVNSVSDRPNLNAQNYSATTHPWHRWGANFSIDPTSGILVSSDPFSGFSWCWLNAPKNGSQPVDFVQGAGAAVNPPVASGTANDVGATAMLRIGARDYWSTSGRIYSVTAPFGPTNRVPDIVEGEFNMAGTLVTTDTFDFKVNPSVLATDGSRLLAADGSRIAVWNSAPTTSNTQISYAIGQPNTTTNAANTGGITASSVSSVPAFAISASKLIVADAGNNRVLIWNNIPTTSGAAADVVLGQSSFSAATIGIGSAGMSGPDGVAIFDGKLVVADAGNLRLLVWNSIPTVAYVPADTIVDLTQAARFSLPAIFSSQALAPRLLYSYAGALYIGLVDRILVVPNIF